MEREELFIKCNDYNDYGELMNYLEALDFKWASGEKPTQWNFYSHCKVNTQLSIVIVINVKLKDISYFVNHSAPQFEYIYSVDGVKNDLLNYLNKSNKISFDDLKCADFRACSDCPINLECCGFINEANKTFGELIKKFGKKLEEAKNEYEKGDK